MGYRSILRKDCFAGQIHIVTGAGGGIGRCEKHDPMTAVVREGEG